MSEENKAETRRFIEEVFNQGNLDVLDELVLPEWVHHDPASPEEERGSESPLRQRREISEPLKGNAKSPKVTRGPVGKHVRRLAGAPDLRPSSRSIPSAGSSNSSPSERMGTSPLARSRSTESENFGVMPAHLSRIEVEIDSSASFHARAAEFVDKMSDALELRPTRLAKIELRLSAGLNPSGASNLDLKQRTEHSNEEAGG